MRAAVELAVAHHRRTSAAGGLMSFAKVSTLGRISDNSGSQIRSARINGTLRMKHDSPARNEDSFIDAVLTGFVEYDPVSRTVQRLRLVTKKTTYGDEEFLAALRSVSPAR